MKSRERFKACLNMERTDRPPFNIEACPEIWDQLQKYFHVTSNDEVCDRLGTDFRRIYGIKTDPILQVPDDSGRIRDFWGIKHFPGESLYASNAIAPLSEAETPDDIERYDWPNVDEIDCSEVAQFCSKYHDNFVTYGGWWSPFFHTAGALLGYEKFMMSFCLYPDMLRSLLDKIVGIDLQINKKYLANANGKLDILYVGNDFGTQLSLAISRENFDIFIVPCIKKYVNLAHEFNVIFMQHSCGAIEPIIPSLVDCEIDILDPIQVNATGMNFNTLVNKYRGRLAFHGGIDTQDLLINATPSKVTEIVEEQVRVAKHKVPYIVSGSQNFTEDTPLENILALYKMSQSV